MKLEQVKLNSRVLNLRFLKNLKKNIFKGKQAGCSFGFEDLKTKTRYADVFKRQNNEKS